MFWSALHVFLLFRKIGISKRGCFVKCPQIYIVKWFSYNERAFILISYDNKFLLFFNTISKIFELPTIPNPSAASLRIMIDEVSAIYNSLLSLGDEKQVTNAIIIHIVMTKVDNWITTSYHCGRIVKPP